MRIGRSLATWLVLGSAVGASALACSSATNDGGFDRAPGTPSGADAGVGLGDDDEGPTTPDDFGGDGTEPPPSGACAPNPLNFDVPDNGCDDDADGIVDNPPRGCDQGLPVGGDAFAFARALGLCQRGDNTRWGVVSAEYTLGYNNNQPARDPQHGILPKFGDIIRPREGAALGVLSTGYAREYNGLSGTAPFKRGATMFGGAQVPPGFPKPAAGCTALPLNIVLDVINVRLKIRVPRNAQGLQFDFNFFSGEWPEYVCTPFNDAFIAFLTSSAFNGGRPDNISFDAQRNPVSVNNGFFDRCTPGAQTGCGQNPPTLKVAACPGGTAELAGTGFEAPGKYCNDAESVGGGATGWLTSRAPVKGGEEITLEFMIWDTGDASWDSSVLLDNFRWVAGKTEAKTERPR